MINQDLTKAHSHQLIQYALARNTLTLLKKMSKFDINHLLKIATSQNKNALENELKRLRKIKHEEKIQPNIDIDNEYVLLAIINYMKALTHNNPSNIEPQPRTNQALKSSYHKEQEETRQAIIIRRIDMGLDELQRNDLQLRKFMQTQVIHKEQIDYLSCYEFFSQQLHKIKKVQEERLFFHRMYIFEIIIYFLTKVIKENKLNQNTQYEYEFQDRQNDDEQSSNQLYSQYESINYDRINKWKNVSSSSLYHKLIELSSICQQIPQLQAFNRTLQFAQLQHEQRAVFFKIVEVIISLHHRISFLSRSQPNVVRECEQLLQEINITNSRCSRFLTIFEQEDQELLPIVFSKADSKSKGYFNQSLSELKSHLTRMSETIVSQDICHTVNFNKLNSLLELVDLFMKVLSGDHESLTEWNKLIENINEVKDKKEISVQEYKLIMMLEQCLQIQNSKLESFQRTNQRSTTRTNEQLEEQVNKLIEDYQRLKLENAKICENMDYYARAKEQLELEVSQRDNMIHNLSMLKITLQKRLSSKEQTQHKSKKQEHETQKYLQSSLLLREQLKISETERQRLVQLLQAQRQKNIKQYELTNKLRGQKERLQIDLEEINDRIENMKVQNLRQQNRLNKNVNDIGNEKHLLQMQLQTSDINNARLIQRLQANQKKLAEYSRLVLARFQEKPDHKGDNESKSFGDFQQKLQDKERQIQKLKRQIASMKRQHEKIYIEQDHLMKQNHWLKEQNQQLKYKKTSYESHNGNQSNLSNEVDNERIKKMMEELDRERKETLRLHKRIEQLYEEKRQTQHKSVTDPNVKEIKERNDWFLKEIESYKSKILEQERLMLNNDNLFKRQLNFANDNIRQVSGQIMKKDSIESELKGRIHMLQTQLSKSKRQNTDIIEKHSSIQQSHYEHTIEKQKIIELKLRQQAKALEKQLETKIQLQIKLNLQIEKLSKEIDRIKNELNRFLKELTEKEIIIKAEQEKNYVHLRSIREYQAKESVRTQQERSIPNSPEPYWNKRDTPLKDQQSIKFTKGRDSSVVSKRHESNQDNNGSRSERQHSGYKSNIKYDIYFNLKEYERLYKEYNDYKLLVASKVQDLQNMQNTIHQLTQAKLSLEQKLQIRTAQITKLQSTLQGQQVQINEIPSLREKIRHLTQKNTQMMLIINSGNQTMMLKKEIQSLKQSLLKLENICNLNKNQKMSILSNFSQLQEENRQLNEQNQHIKMSVSQLQVKNKELTEAKAKGTTVIANSQLQFTFLELKQKSNIVQKENIRLSRQIVRLQQKIKGNHSSHVNLNYYLQKIKYLQEALQAVGDELTDSKQAMKSQTNNSGLFQPGFGKSKDGKDQSLLDKYKTQITTLRYELQTKRFLQNQWIQKERLYLHELQNMTQQNFTLKDSISRNTKLITTSFPHQMDFKKNTYVNIQRKQSNKSSLKGNDKHQQAQKSLDLQNLLQFVYRILIFFSQVENNSVQASKIRLQLQKISDSTSGGIFFTSLEQYTIHILQNNAIQEYKRELRNKAHELLQIKERLDELITRKIQQEQSILNRKPLHKSRYSSPYQEYHETIYSGSNK